MREIINIQVGNCGNKLATSFWTNILKEHGIQPDSSYTGTSDLQLKNINAYFHEHKENHYVPRATLVDLEPTSIDEIQAGPLGSLFDQKNCFIGRGGSSNSFARGFYREGREWIDIAMNKIRKQAEQCDGLQGFQMTHSLGGGTGSGMGCLIASQIKEEYPKSLTQTFPVFPSEKVSDVIVEPYNAVLALNQLVEYTDMIQVIHNEALYRICCQQGEQIKPINYQDFNTVAAEVMTALTCTLRFPGELNNTMRKMATNLVPFPGLPFLIAGFSEIPQSKQNTADPQYSSTSSIRQRLLDSNYYISDTGPFRGYFVSASLVYRGYASLKEVDEAVMRLENRGSPILLGWIPHNLKGWLCEVPQSTWKLCGVFNGNSTGIYSVFRNSLDAFDSVYQQKAFVHRYLEEGMDEEEFLHAGSSLEDVISEYIALQDFSPDEEYEDSDEWEA